MDDLISRQAAIEAMHQYSYYNDSDASVLDEEIAIIALKDLPSVQPTADTCPYYCELLPGTEKQCIKIRHGKWISVGVPGEDYECDQCGYICEVAHRVGKPYKYCPNCGSKNEVGNG